MQVYFAFRIGRDCGFGGSRVLTRELDIGIDLDMSSAGA